MARILVIDDEEDVLETLRVLLKSEGHKVLPVREGLAAIELIQSLESIDLMVVDLRMAPVDGMELIRVAHQVRPQMGIVVVSAYLDEANIKRVVDLGCKVYVKKPFDVNEVLDAVREELIRTGVGVAGETQE
ncbi:MAG: response regulator [Kiritimatiellae bacterium]|nr:response regulator [Kiritimatiellia bacterium]